jgi:hypothetical protein
MNVKAEIQNLKQQGSLLNDYNIDLIRGLYRETPKEQLIRVNAAGKRLANNTLKEIEEQITTAKTEIEFLKDRIFLLMQSKVELLEGRLKTSKEFRLAELADKKLTPDEVKMLSNNLKSE